MLLSVKLLMKQLLLICAVAVLVGCGKASPAVEIVDPTVEKAVRAALFWPKGELTEADLQDITYLNLKDTKITGMGLAELAKLKNLKDLVLTDTKITDEGLKEVTKLKNLERLNLEDTQITDLGLKELAKLEKLTLLVLFGIEVTDEGLAELKKALPNCEITGP